MIHCNSKHIWIAGQAQVHDCFGRRPRCCCPLRLDVYPVTYADNPRRLKADSSTDPCHGQSQSSTIFTAAPSNQNHEADFPLIPWRVLGRSGPSLPPC